MSEKRNKLIEVKLADTRRIKINIHYDGEMLFGADQLEMPQYLQRIAKLDRQIKKLLADNVDLHKIAPGRWEKPFVIIDCTPTDDIMMQAMGIGSAREMVELQDKLFKFTEDPEGDIDDGKK